MLFCIVQCKLAAENVSTSEVASMRAGFSGDSSMLASSSAAGSSVQQLQLAATCEGSAATSDSDNESTDRSLLATSTPKRSRIAPYVRDLHVSLDASVHEMS